MTIEKDFWKHKTLTEMSSEEWNSLCSRCGVCCLCKIIDTDGKIQWTNIACYYLDFETRTCQIYDNRKNIYPRCIKLTPDNVKDFEYLPETCVYRMLADGKPLPDWHPLITGDPNSVSQNPHKLKLDNIIKKSKDK